MGISSHSEPSTLYIFSVMKSDISGIDNELLHAQMKRYLKGSAIPFVEVLGRYDGVVEAGFLINAQDVPEEAIVAYSRVHKQDCYLTVTQHRHGIRTAVFTNPYTGAKTSRGFFRSLDEATVKALELDYTYRKDVNTYWVIWPTDTTNMTDFEEEVDFAKAHGFAALWL